MEKQQERTKSQILISSSLASFFSTIATNPLEVIKVRKQKASQIHTVQKNSNKLQQQVSQNTIKCKSFTMQQKYNMCTLCQQESCLQNLNFLLSMKKILKTEGFFSLFAGLRYSIVQAGISTVNYMFFYEQAQIQLQKYIYNEKSTLFYLNSSFIARFITTTIIFPFEYLRMLEIGKQQNKKSILQNIKSMKGYKVTLQRDLIFSGIYWSIVEKIRQNDKTSLKNNILSGVIAGGFTSFITVPLDVVKTRQQLNEGKNTNYQRYNIMQQMQYIYRTEGIEKLFAGGQPRAIKAASHCALLLGMYEYFINMFQQQKYRNYY